MTPNCSSSTRVALACGGTGGHIFPGLAVAASLVQQGCQVTLLVSTKEVDRLAVQQAPGLQVHALPAVGLARGRAPAFLRGFAQSFLATLKLFRTQRPRACLAMGGFTSAAPLLAAKCLRARTFLHESNTIPGRANRWLSWLVGQAFVGFPAAAEKLHAGKVTVTGTPVRDQFHLRDPGPCRAALGLDPAHPVIAVMGGSQGAAAINQLVLDTLPLLARSAPHWQWIHLAGPADIDTLKKNYRTLGFRALVSPFLQPIELAMGAANAAVSRAGASSMAELAAMRLPAVLIPYPAATDDHQWHNARAFEQTGAARLLEQSRATPPALAELLMDLEHNPQTRQAMQSALACWHSPQAAQQIAMLLLADLHAAAGWDPPCAAPLVPRRCL
jgi:UDP-N-acetylglucosamine--N-acetylmuramyl-(pentapeptide) pyrophosphoryl-undecaprenol N-acetylglucosamine transferase